VRPTTRKLRAVALVGAAVAAAAFLAVPPDAGAAAADGSVTVSRDVSRVNLVDGADQVVESKHVSATVSSTQALRDRETVTITWSGAHTTSGLYPDTNSGQAAEEEYPFVILQCRGKDDPNLPVAQQVRPETCWTSTPYQRYSSSSFLFPPWRLDRYESAANRTVHPGQPDPLPDACQGFVAGATRWLHFVGADGKDYPGGGGVGCAGIAPEAVVVEGSTPSNETYGHTDAAGNGSAKFIVRSADSVTSLGCSDTVACSIVMIPIMGISCDAAAADLPTDDQPVTYGASAVTAAAALCQKTGHYAPGDFAASSGQEDLSVSGLLWYSASNWRNRLSVPITMAPSPTACSILNTSAPLYVYGSESMIQTSLQWAPHFCLDPKLFKFQHVQVPEPQAKNLLVSGAIEAAFQAGPPDTPFPRPTVQAPVAYTGFAVATLVDDQTGHELTGIKLTPRLIAKLLTESYPSNANVRADLTDLPSSNPEHVLATNPLIMAKDPEFIALNPTAVQDPGFYEPASTMYVMSSDSDVMSALTAYINADPEARAWLNGKPDPWGMVVNPNYKDIALPVKNWPMLDTLVSQHMVESGNTCVQVSPVPWLPLVASPVSAMATITLNMQYGLAQSTIRCSNPGDPNQKLVALGRERPGVRFALGLVSLGDVARYKLDTAALQTSVSAGAATAFDGDSGRTFVQPTDASMRAAAALFKANRSLNTWAFDYGALASSPTAYPGALLMSMDVPTSGLTRADAAKYATFLRFAAGPGQTPGVGSGDLADGFMPLTADNGLGAQAAYTSRAATAVQAQKGDLPLVTGGTVPGPTPTPTTSSSGDGSGSGSGSGAGGTGSTGGTPSAAPTPAPSAAPSASPTPATASGGVVAVGLTQGVDTGPAGLLLPLVLLLAIACALAIPVSAVIGRYRGQG
jgi:hypothetical protein